VPQPSWIGTSIRKRPSLLTSNRSAPIAGDFRIEQRFGGGDAEPRAAEGVYLHAPICGQPLVPRPQVWSRMPVAFTHEGTDDFDAEIDRYDFRTFVMVQKDVVTVGPQTRMFARNAHTVERLARTAIAEARTADRQNKRRARREAALKFGRFPRNAVSVIYPRPGTEEISRTRHFRAPGTSGNRAGHAVRCQ
jgi:hypothetical protein